MVALLPLSARSAAAPATCAGAPTPPARAPDPRAGALTPCTRAIAPLALALATACVSSAHAAGEITPWLQPGSRAAPGIGGDPFRSPLMDECGWWSEPGFTPSPLVRVQSVASEPISKRATRGGGSLSFGETSWHLLGATRIGGRPLAFAGRLSSPRWSGRLPAAGGELRFSGERSRVEAGVRVEGVAPGLSAQVVGPLWTEGGGRQTTNLGAGLRYRPRPWLAAQASWRGTRTPEAFSSDLYGQPIAASINLRSEQRRLDARVTLRHRVALEGSIARTGYSPIAPATPAFRYEITPAGSSRMDQASARVEVARGLGALARWTRAGFDAEGEAVWGGERFGRLNYARASLESRLLAFESRGAGGTRWLLDAERARAQGEARVVLETWPFTSTLVDLLGLRRIGRVSAEARWHRLHAAVERPLGVAGRAHLGLAWYDVRPVASIESWRPAFLVFGRADDRVDRLGFHRAQLAALSLGGTWRLGGIEHAIAIEQFVFAKTFRTAPAGAAAPAAPSGHPVGDDGDDPGGGRAGGWPGGTRLEFSLSRRF